MRVKNQASTACKDPECVWNSFNISRQCHHLMNFTSFIDSPENSLFDLQPSPEGNIQRLASLGCSTVFSSSLPTVQPLFLKAQVENSSHKLNSMWVFFKSEYQNQPKQHAQGSMTHRNIYMSFSERVPSLC